MSLRKFSHISVSSLEEAVSVLSQNNGKAIAGGTDLLGTLKDRIHTDYPESIVDLKKIPGLSYVKAGEKSIKIGAMTTLAEICKNEAIQKDYPLLAEAARSVASPEIRNMATLGGNICQEPRCWYYRAPDNAFHCLRKGGTKCAALLGDNRYHSIFGSVRVAAPACSETCPGNIEIPAYMESVRNGDLAGAARILLNANPIPAITGRICPHLCESKCNRSDFDEAVSIRGVERVIGDYILDNTAEFLAPPKKELKASVAIVGSGPAGLSAAFYLRKAGYQVTVFEKLPEAGGMLFYGIPAHRLPKDVVRKQVAGLAGMGIKFQTNTEVGTKGVTFEDLRTRFTYLFLGSGAWGDRSLDIDKRELLTPGIEFLSSIELGRNPKVGKKVLVIGGGNVAVDVAVTARRLGADKVTMVCLEPRDAMPAFEEELEEAVHVGVEFITSYGPHKIIEKNGELTGLEMISCTSVFDGNGRFNPSFDSSVKKIVDADQIILAIGQATELSYTEGKVASQRGLIVIDGKTLETNVDGVYAGGDITSGPQSVIHAIAAGRRSARAISGEVPESYMPMGQSLEMNCDGQLKCNRTQNIDGMDDLKAEAIRCINCSCIAVSASDIAPALLALGASIETTQRSIAADEFFAAGIMKCTVLEHGELIKEIEIPAPVEGNRQGYLKFRIRNAIDFPIVSLAYSFAVSGQVIKDANVVLGAVAPVPVKARAVEAFLDKKPMCDDTALAAGDIVARDIRPLYKNEFKVQVVKALIRKMLA